MAASWLKEYQKYIVDIQTFRFFEDELHNFGIIFKFPNGYGVRVEFEADAFIMCSDDYIRPAINVHVEMLDKGGERYNEKSFNEVKTEKFPERYRIEFILPSYVEEFIKCVYELS